MCIRDRSETIRTDRFRLIRHSQGGRVSHVELYDHENDPGETRNIARTAPERVRELGKKLDAKLN